MKPVRHFIAVAGLTLACSGEEPVPDGKEGPGEMLQGVVESSEGAPETEPVVLASGESRTADAGGEQQASEKPAPAPCLLYTSPSPRDKRQSRMPSSA